MTIQELTQNEKYKFWYLKIMECKESDLSVQDFCERNNIKASTYYKYQQKIKTVLCHHINNETELKNVVAFITVDKVSGLVSKNNAILIRTSSGMLMSPRSYLE